MPIRPGWPSPEPAEDSPPAPTLCENGRRDLTFPRTGRPSLPYLRRLRELQELSMSWAEFLKLGGHCTMRFPSVPLSGKRQTNLTSRLQLSNFRRRHAASAKLERRLAGFCARLLTALASHRCSDRQPGGVRFRPNSTSGRQTDGFSPRPEARGGGRIINLLYLDQRARAPGIGRHTATPAMRIAPATSARKDKPREAIGNQRRHQAGDGAFGSEPLVAAALGALEGRGLRQVRPDGPLPARVPDGLGRDRFRLRRLRPTRPHPVLRPQRRPERPERQAICGEAF